MPDTWRHPALLVAVSIMLARSSGGAPPLPGRPDSRALKSFTGALELRPDGVTEVEISPEGGQARFVVNIPGKETRMLRLGVLNSPGSSVTVFDARGAPYDPTDKGWAGEVNPGNYFLRVDAPRRAPHDQAPPELRPSVLAIVDPVGPGTTPSKAAQLGLNYITIASTSWQNRHKCNGCHVQSQALMGMQVAKRNGYRVYDQAANSLGEFMQKDVRRDEDKDDLFSSLATSYFVEGFAPNQSAALIGKAEALLKTAKSSKSIPNSVYWATASRRPVLALAITGTSMAVRTLAAAARIVPERRAELLRVIDQAVLFLAEAPPEYSTGGQRQYTVQDHAMKIIAFSQVEGRNAAIAREALALLAMQNEDGGFGEDPRGGPSNAYGTGQALYALRLAGLPEALAASSRAVRWLLDHQIWNGAWPRDATLCESEIAPTMWAVIGLTGAFSSERPKGSLMVIPAGDIASTSEMRMPAGSVELVLDASGSMWKRLGASTRIQTARDVLHELISNLPSDTRVGLRVYGHRFRTGPLVCTDTELLVPIGPLDRAR